MTYPQLIKLQNSHNFRDLGGYPTQDGGETRRGMIYRSDTLCRLNDEDRRILREIRLRTVFDLREAFDREREGDDQVDEDMRVVKLPTSLGIEAALRAGKIEGFQMRDFYIGSMEPRLEYHAHLFRQVTDPDHHPAVIHCSAGKDRTGIIVALLLRVAGVSDEHIINDYAETETHLLPATPRVRQFMQQVGLPDPIIDELLSSTPENMRALLCAYQRQHEKRHPRDGLAIQTGEKPDPIRALLCLISTPHLHFLPEDRLPLSRADAPEKTTKTLTTTASPFGKSAVPCGSFPLFLSTALCLASSRVPSS